MAESTSFEASEKAMRMNLSPGAKSSRFLNRQMFACAREKENEKSLLSKINHLMSIAVFGGVRVEIMG